MQQRPPYLSVALISGAALAYEILLMRLFSIIQWHHFSYMIIGLALLGYGFSGTIVSIFQSWLQSRFRIVYLSCLLLFGLTSTVSFILAQSLPFNAEMILWDNRQLIYLLVIFLLLSLPFFFAATATCLAFMHFQNRVSRIYAWHLAGAGVGSLAVIGLLFFFFTQHALIVIKMSDGHYRDPRLAGFCVQELARVERLTFHPHAETRCRQQVVQLHCQGKTIFR